MGLEDKNDCRLTRQNTCAVYMDFLQSSFGHEAVLAWHSYETKLGASWDMCEPMLGAHALAVKFYQ